MATDAPSDDNAAMAERSPRAEGADGHLPEPDGDQPSGLQDGRHGGRTSRGPTPELKQAADEVAAKVDKGEMPTLADALRMRLLGALDAIRSPRPTVRVKGIALFEEICREQAGHSPASNGGLSAAAVDETPF